MESLTSIIVDIIDINKCTYKPPVYEPVVETNPSIKEDDGITVNKDGTWTMTPEQMLKGFMEVMKMQVLLEVVLYLVAVS